MPVYPKTFDEFKSSLHQVRVNNVWKIVPQIYVKNGDIWKSLYSYNWEVGQWSECSVACGDRNTNKNCDMQKKWWINK